MYEMNESLWAQKATDPVPFCAYKSSFIGLIYAIVLNALTQTHVCSLTLMSLYRYGIQSAGMGQHVINSVLL